MARDRIERSEMVFLGADPEFFLEYKGKLAPVEEIVKEVGEDRLFKSDTAYNSFQDGLAFELTISPTSCRQIFAERFSKSIRHIVKGVGKKDIILSKKNHFKLTNKQLEKLSIDSLNFGCEPSRDAWNKGEEKTIDINPLSYKHRFAGGHIHLGVKRNKHDRNNRVYAKTVLKNRVKLVKLLDYVVGNLSVLLDRDTDNKLRRETYGQAGEYRSKYYGVEYRVLSNFWFRNYRTLSLISGLARACVDMIGTNKEYGYDDEILSAVPKEDIIRAINENNVELALQNYKKIEPILKEIVPEATSSSYFDALNKIVCRFNLYMKRDMQKFWGQWGSWSVHDGWERYSHKLKTRNRC